MTHVHLLGIGGTGISAIARLLLELGYTVSGSDRASSTFSDELASAGVAVTIGHQAENIHGADLVIRSSAVAEDNPEVLAARKAGIPVLKRADFLGSLMAGRTGIAVAGTHGKTTTTAMIAWMLTSLGQEPSFLVGGVPSNLGVNARAGKGQTFVIEADEYDRMFLGLKPVIEVVTNIEHDHPDCFPTPAEFMAAFEQFLALLPSAGTLVACADDPGAAALMASASRAGKKVMAYGIDDPGKTGRPVDVSARDLTTNGNGGFTFIAEIQSTPLQVELQVPGRHNVLNALAALSVARLLDLSMPKAAVALSAFTGTGRRFEVKGILNDIVIIDDYAHHPSEIRATLSAARSRYPTRRLRVVWQPHTYSRTQTLAVDFALAFRDADEVIVTEIFPSREAWQPYSARSVVEAMPHPAIFIPSLLEVEAYLLKSLEQGDAVIVLSAGDADQVSTYLLANLKEPVNG
jgi:UDP-N-acetylmuramate--alanine ligase